MEYVVGFIGGVLVCCFIAIVLTFFKAPLVKMGYTTMKQVELAGPRPKGFIYEPEDEATEIRNERIEENRAQGRDTPIEELM